MRNRSSLKSTTIMLMRAVQLVVVGSVMCEKSGVGRFSFQVKPCRCESDGVLVTID